jgi:alkylation response protein AidB-like acyl-CoA dehydrogenase
VALTTLMNERVSLSGAGSAVGGNIFGGATVDQLIARHRPVRDPVLRQELVKAYCTASVIRWNNQRAAALRNSGAEAGPEGSITKLQQALYNRELQDLAVALEGVGAIAWAGSALHATGEERRTSAVEAPGGVAFGLLRSQANTIEGGTSNIMRNILGERVLGLPKEPDASRDLPWREIPRS